MQTLYRAYGHVLASDRPLPELEPAVNQPPDIRIAWDAAVYPAPGASWTTLWRFSRGEPWATVARSAHTRLVRFGRYADFRISNSLIEVAPRGHASDATLRHLLLDQALPLALAGRGAVILHASAVVIDGRATLLAGRAGAGKSTLAAMLAAAGHPVLADDGVLLEAGVGEIRAVPSYAGLRLFADSCRAAHIGGGDVDVAQYTAKRRILPDNAAGRFTSRALPVGRIYTLCPGAEDVSFVRMTSRDAAMELVRHAYRIDLEDRTELEAHLERVACAARLADVWRVGYPRDLSRAGALADAIARHSRTEGASR